MKYDQVIRDLERKIYHPVYFLCGEEPFYIDEISDFIEENVLTDVEKEFNQSVLYGRDVDAAGIVEYAKRFPMMSNYQVVIVKEAQEIRNIEDLQSYIENPLKSTILVLCYKYKKLDKRKSFAKSIEKHGVLFESARIYDNKIPDWINARLKEMGFTIDIKASALMSEYLGNDLSKIRNELEKLVINLEKGTRITVNEVEQNIGISKDYNIFELHNALGKKDILKANRIVNYFADNPKQHPIVLTLGMLYNFYLKVLIYHTIKDKSDRNAVAAELSVHPFFIKDYADAANQYNYRKVTQIISTLREYDLRSKGVDNASTSEGELLKEMVYKIMH